MKKIALSSALSVLLLTSFTACNSEKKASNNDNIKKETRNIEKPVSLEQRKINFLNKLNKLTKMGFDLKTIKDDKGSSSYTISVINSNLAISNILGAFSMNSMDLKTKSELSKIIDKSQIGIDVDWDKYIHDSKKSVFVYLKQTNNADPIMQKLYMDKVLAAYLTFDSSDEMKEAIIKDIDTKVADAVQITHLVLKGARVDIAKSPNKISKQSEYTIYGGDMTYQIDTNGSRGVSISYTNPKCEIKMQDRYLGGQLCSFPNIQISNDRKPNNFITILKDSTIDYNTSAKKNKLSTELKFNIGSVDFKTGDKLNSVATLLQGINIDLKSSNISENIIKEYYDLVSSPTIDNNITIAKSMKIISEFVDNNISYDYSVSLASLKGKSLSPYENIDFSMNRYKTIGQIKFGDNIDFKEKSTISNISVTDLNSSKSLFGVTNLRFGYSLNDIYNIFPYLIKFGTKVVQNPDKADELIAKNGVEFQKQIDKITTQGLRISFSPVGIDKMNIDELGKSIKYDKVDFDLNAKLNPNKVSLVSVMSGMMLLSYLEADGKLELSKADLNQMSQEFSPQVLAMIMMYAKYQGEKAIFELKFEKGHLSINGKLVM